LTLRHEWIMNRCAVLTGVTKIIYCDLLIYKKTNKNLQM
jgi:hypothetical protein